MDKWELSRYVLDAKKSVDTMLYLSENVEKLSMIDIREEINEVKRKFYVNVCIVLDKCFPKQKKEICKESIIKAVYYERDKNYAHKDDNYNSKEYSSIYEIADEIKKQLQYVVHYCENYLPKAITLDFIAFDSKLFRIVNGTTKEIEEQVLNFKHPGRGKKMNISKEDTKTFKVFSDTEDIKKIPQNERNQYATIFSVGICMEETMQHLQDSAVKTNVLYGTNMWVSINQKQLGKILKMRKLGLLDVYDIPYTPKDKEDELKIKKLLKKEGLINE